MDKKTNNQDINERGYEILRILEDNQKISQREISASLGISLGKVNFLLKALIDKGIVKSRNFKNSKNKRAYAYFLTPEGIEEKAKLTINFFKRKMYEYDVLKKQLLDLENEIEIINKNKNKK